jgi:hypothetical protein
MPRKGKASRGARRPESRPISGPDAFTDLRKIDHVQSQAATLLLIGSHQRGDLPAIQARAQVTKGPRLAPAQTTLQRDLEALGFPRMQVGPVRFRSQALQRALGVRFMAAPTARPTPKDVQTASRLLRQAANRFYRDANAETAAALLEAGLRHPHQLVRVAAAASYFDLAADPQRATGVLEEGLNSRDLLTRDVAAYALSHIDPKNPKLSSLLRSRPKRSTHKRSHTSLVVHGTWARSSPWWQPPNGDFWQYLYNHVDSSLYGANDRFEWSGGYSDAARALAGNDLHNWVQQHNLDRLDLFTHSHGGSVAMLANQAGTTVGRMVLLSCPVHWPKYSPDFNKVGKVVSIRVHLDLVILADRGGQLFQDSRIHENVLPIWFDHFATHDPGVWQKYDVPSML